MPDGHFRRHCRIVIEIDGQIPLPNSLTISNLFMFICILATNKTKKKIEILKNKPILVNMLSIS